MADLNIDVLNVIRNSLMQKSVELMGGGNMSITDYTAESVDKLYKIYGKYFNGSFHSVLWELIVNCTHAGKLICFHTAIKSKYYVLGLIIANKYGYIPLMATFKTQDYYKAKDITDKLNEHVFNYSEEFCSDIVMSSMRIKKGEDDGTEPKQTNIRH
jgi:hypothetical protein